MVLVSPARKQINDREFPRSLKSLNMECKNCSPITPFECLNRCQVYRMKNELRRLQQTMADPNYQSELFNVLKNQTRLRILQTIVKGQYSVSQLQHELKSAGHCHSQGTITVEYLRPLIAAGLAAESRDQYYATSFGSRLAEQLGCLIEFAEKLPANSEGHEETLLQSLITGPKTFEEVELVLPPKIVSRILKRVRSTGLITTPTKRDYVFFFRSKRDSTKDTFTTTERRVYDAIPDQGISAGRLAKATKLSMRRTYKYLRGLKGKKLVFARRTPKTYALTRRGEKLALVLQEVQQLVEDTWDSCQQVMHNNQIMLDVGGLSSHALRT